MGLKDILGAELWEQVTGALKGKGEGGKDIELAIANDGSMIPASKFNELNDKYKAADKLARETKEALDGLKAAGDPAELKSQLEKAQSDAKKQADDHKAAMAELELTYAVRGALTDAQDPDIVAGLLDKTQLKLENGKLSGLDEQLKTLKESKAFLFKDPEGGGFSGPKPGSGGSGGQTDPEKMTMEEYRAYRQKDGGFPRN